MGAGFGTRRCPIPVQGRRLADAGGSGQGCVPLYTQSADALRLPTNWKRTNRPMGGRSHGRRRPAPEDWKVEKWGGDERGIGGCMRKGAVGVVSLSSSFIIKLHCQGKVRR